MIKEALRLHRLFKRGFLADSPDFIQEKQVDGRYLLKLRGGQSPTPVVSRHIPTGLMKSVTLEGYAGPSGGVVPDYHFGPETWNRISDLATVTAIGQFNHSNPDPDYFNVGIDYRFPSRPPAEHGFQIRPFFAIWLPPYIDVLENFFTLVINSELADSCDLIISRRDVGNALTDIDISSGFIDRTQIGSGVEARFIVHIVWDR